MKKCLCLLAATILAFSSLANAQIYKSVDANGVVTFSDKPSAKERGAAGGNEPPHSGQYRASAFCCTC